jgi:hypothetical protein
MKCRILRIMNRIVARLRGSVGWCGAAYQFNRNGLLEETDEHGTWAEIPSQGIIKSWWGAFMFKWRTEE